MDSSVYSECVGVGVGIFCEIGMNFFDKSVGILRGIMIGCFALEILECDKKYC
jgi:hypothetical protein